MTIYNVTVKVDHTIAAGWLTWMKKEYIPAMTGTGCFTHAVILHLAEADDEEGITYAIQYHATDNVLFDQYRKQFAAEMSKLLKEKWGNHFVEFSTLMHVVN